MATNVNFGIQQYSTFDPRALPGCYIWSDAASLSNLANGTTVSSWTNLGSGGTITATGTVSNAVLNNRTVVNFTNTQTWVTGTTVNLSAYSLFAVSRQTGSANFRVLQSTTNNQLYGYWGGYKKAIYIDNNPTQLTTQASDTAWDLMSHTRTAGGAYTFNWNGSSVFSAASSTANNMTGLTINAGAFAENSACQIAEIILFSNVLSLQQVQQVEGYLAWKWGLTSNLPTTHPFRYTPVAMRLFQPMDNPGLQMWLDASDPSTLTLTSTQVTQWRDKSGRSNHVAPVGTYSNATVSSNYLNGLNALSFSGSNVYRSSNASAAYPTDVFLVMALKSGGGRSDIISVTPPTGDNFTGFTTGAYGTNFQYNQASSLGSRSYNISTFTETSNTNVILGWTISNNSMIIWRNGTAIGSSAAYTWTLPTNATYSIGLRVDPSVFGSGVPDIPFEAYIGEVIAYSNRLTAAQRQQIEGYLATKWGLRSSLSSHPYSVFPPLTAIFSPHQISNCALWFDGADTTTASGLSTITWVSKGTLSTSATTTTGTSSYFFNFFNGFNFVNIPASSEMQFTTAINTQARTWFVVGRLQTNATSGAWEVLGSAVAGQTVLRLVTVAGTYQISVSLNGSTVMFGTTPNGNFYNRVGIYSIVHSATVASNVITDNGTPLTLTTSVAASGYVTTSATSIFSTASQARGGDLMEVIMYYGDLSVSDRQRVEGYLAWKWGLEANLPSTHPFFRMCA